MHMDKKEITPTDIDRIIEMAWEDRTPFEAIELQFGLLNKEVIDLMRSQLTPNSFKRWRKRNTGRATKHQELGNLVKGRFKSSLQKAITNNRISKR